VLAIRPDPMRATERRTAFDKPPSIEYIRHDLYTINAD